MSSSPTNSPAPRQTLVQVLTQSALSIGDKDAFRFVRSNGQLEAAVTFQELHDRAKAIAAELKSRFEPGARAILLYPPGVELISAFFGCLYAGVIAVPAALPVRSRLANAVGAIVRAAQPAVILSTSPTEDASRLLQISELRDHPWLATDTIASGRGQAWRDPGIEASDTAFLQYTSGSTSTPKGVALTHQNILYNAELIRQAFGNAPDRSAVFWLPLYHDMGLIGGVLQPVYCQCTCTLMAPASFLQRPALWLELISSTGAMVSGGPNFGYDLCARKVRAEDRKSLDLSRWELAFTGAERIRAETIDRFVEAFGPCGFRREAFFPCYGLAEATLMASGGPRNAAPSVLRLSSSALKGNRIEGVDPDSPGGQSFVGCGEQLPGQELVIVDPETRERSSDSRIGEIWIRGPSVSAGYYNLSDATEETFGAVLSSGESGFLRTGDLGFLRDGQLYVTGRRKDLIIIRGRNYYPEDIEHSVNNAHPGFRPGYCAAFSIETDDREQLVVLQEIDPRHRNLDADEALRAVRQMIATEHELEVHAVILTSAGEISKTSSGKTQRSACRERYRDGQLHVVASWQASQSVAADVAEDPPHAEHVVTRDELEDWLVRRIAAHTGLPREQVHAGTSFLEYGLGSIDAVEIAGELEAWLGRPVSPTAIYNHPNAARWPCG